MRLKFQPKTALSLDGVSGVAEVGCHRVLPSTALSVGSHEDTTLWYADRRTE